MAKPANAAVTWLFLNNHLANKPVPMVNFCGDATYLGIRLDRRLGIKDYVDHITIKARKGLAPIKKNEATSSLILGIGHLNDRNFNTRLHADKKA